MTESGAKPRRKRLSADARREQILDAARTVFLDSGYAGARTQDIASAAGVNSALVFRHFESKEEIFKAAVVEPLKEIMARANEGDVTSDLDEMTETKRQHAVITIGRMLRTLSTAAPLLGVVLFADKQAGASFWQEHISSVFDLGGTRIRQGFGTWSHRNFDPEFTTKIVFGMCLSLAMDAYFTGQELDADRAAADLADLLLDGLRAR
jgi:AcrR family transcriptional regulator